MAGNAGWTVLNWAGALLFGTVLLAALWRRQWSGFGLALALCLGFKGWTHLDALLAVTERGSIEARAQMVWVALYIVAMLGSVLRPRAGWTTAIMVACAHLLFTGAIPLVRDLLGFGAGTNYAIARLPVSHWLGVSTSLLFAIGPGLWAIPWALVRQSNASPGLLAAAQAQYARLFGAGLAMLMVLVPVYFAWGLIGRGAFSGFPLVPVYAGEGASALSGVNAAVAVLLGLMVALFWIVPRRFIEQAVVLIEASQRDGQARLEDLAHPLWRDFARTLDQLRSAAATSRDELEQARAQLAGFFEHAPVAMSLGAPDGRIVLANRAVADAYGRAPDQLGDMTPGEISAFWPEVATMLEAMGRLLESGEPQRFTTPFKATSEAEPLLYDVVIFPVRGSDGSITQIGSLGIDVTAQRRAEEALAQREAQLAGFFEHAPVALTLMEPDGRVSVANRMAADPYGVGVEQFRAMGMADMARYWPELDQMVARYRQVLEAGAPQRMTTPLIAPDQAESRLFDYVLFPVKAPDGSVAQVGHIAIDVTSQHSLMAELETKSSTLQAFFDNIPAMTFIIAPDRRYVTSNSYAVKNYGLDFLSPENLIGQPDITGTPEAWHPVIEEAHRKVMERGETHVAEPSFDLPNGSLHLLVSRFPIRNAEGEITHVGGLIFDRTADKKASEDIATAREALHQSEKLAALGQLLAGVAHELNNPLTVVVGRSAILEEKLQDTPHGKAITDLREAADRCNRIVRTFLAMARQSAPRRAPVQVNDAIEAALDMTAYGLRTSGIELVRKFASDLPEIEADEDQLVQVITNLLINANHALEGRSGARVTLTTRVKGGRVQIEVADNGPGVPAEIASRIFEPFFTTKGVGDGTGMGLAMSRGMIEEHGGTLRYSNAKDGGAMFTIELPLGEIAETETPVANSPKTVPKARGRVLIIDDEAAIRGLLAEILEGIDLECIQCGDGAAALALLDEEAFDVVFCDLRMPVMDGVRLREELAERHPELLDKLVFISGDTLQRGTRRNAAIAGHAFIEKPFNPAEVRQVALDKLGNEGAAQ